MDKEEDKVEDPVKTPTEGEQLGSDATNADAEGKNTSAGEDTPEASKDTPEDTTEDTTEGKEDNTPSDTLDTDVWGSSGDETVDSVLIVLQNSGIPVEDAKALIYDPLTEHGDPTKIDKDALIEKVGKANANLVMAGLENYVSKANATTAEVLKSVYAVAGGKEQWDQVSPWAKDKLPAEDLKDYSEMLDAGGAKAKFAASEIIRRYNADPKNTSVGGTTTLEGDSTAGDQGEAITKQEYADRLARAHRRGPKPGEIQTIQLARERGRKKDI